MRLSGPILVISSALTILFLVLYLLGGQRVPESAVGEKPPQSVSKKDQIRHLLSGDFKRDPDKNPDAGDGRLRGIVRDESGNPLRGAKVQVIPIDEQADVRAPRTEYPHFWEMETDDDGYLEFRTMPAGAFAVIASRENAHGIATTTVVENGAFAEVFPVIAPAGACTGHVEDANGNPVEGALVVPVAAANWPGDARPYRYFPVTTGPDGGFAHPLLPDGAWQFLVTADGFAPELVKPEDDGSYLATLGTGADLTGSVVRADDGRPLSNVRVVLQASDAPGETHLARTNGQGYVVFERLRPASYTARLDSDTHLASSRVTVSRAAPSSSAATPASRKMQIDPLTGTARATPESSRVPDDPPAIAATPSGLRLEARAAGSVRGRVLQSGDAIGVPGMTVEAYAESATTPAAVAQTDQAGYYQLNGLDTQGYTLTVRRDGDHVFFTETPEIQITGGQLQSGPLFRAEVPVSVTGEVRDGTGARVADANIVLHVTGVHGGPNQFAADGTGQFRITGLSPRDQIALRAQLLGRESDEFGPVTVGSAGLQQVMLRLN